jgi:tRNA (guanine37-N1)-methyltransferase
MDKKVPEVLLSGHHKKIEQWRLEQSVIRTKQMRPDLYAIYEKEQVEKQLQLKLEKQEQKRLRKLQLELELDKLPETEGK